MAQIIEASIDEHGSASGGAAGDQTGNEVKFATFDPDYPWDKVLICTDQDIVDKMIKEGEKICKSSLVGYDQGQRNTFHTQLKKNNYNVSDYIDTRVKSETDCSAFITAIAIGGGVKDLEYPNDGNAPTTSTMVKEFTSTKKFKSKDYKKNMELKPGYILVREGHHTAMYVG